MAQPKELTIGGYREVMAAEIKRLNDLCSEWQPKAEGDGQVRCAIGKASILISGKIRQFGGLIDDCEAKHPRTRLGDLQGFWDMIGLQIDNVDAMFRDLSKPPPPPQPQAPEPSVAKAKAVKKKAVSTLTTAAVKRPSSSAIKAHISAKRREMMSNQTENEDVVVANEGRKPLVTVSKVAGGGAADEDKVVFDGGFFKVTSPSPNLRGASPKTALTPSGYNIKRGAATAVSASPVRRRPGGQACKKSSMTPMAIIAATKAARRSLSPSVRRASLDFD